MSDCLREVVYTWWLRFWNYSKILVNSRNAKNKCNTGVVAPENQTTPCSNISMDNAFSAQPWTWRTHWPSAALDSAFIHRPAARNSSPSPERPLLKSLPFYCDVFYPAYILENHKSSSKRPRQVVYLLQPPNLSTLATITTFHINQACPTCNPRATCSLGRLWTWPNRNW